MTKTQDGHPVFNSSAQKKKHCLVHVSFKNNTSYSTLTWRLAQHREEKTSLEEFDTQNEQTSCNQVSLNQQIHAVVVRLRVSCTDFCHHTCAATASFVFAYNHFWSKFYKYALKTCSFFYNLFCNLILFDWIIKKQMSLHTCISISVYHMINQDQNLMNALSNFGSGLKAHLLCHVLNTS